MTIIVTGGAGFISGNFVYHMLNKYPEYRIVCVGGLAWNDPEIGIEWSEVKGEYSGSASAEGYALNDGTKLNLSDKDQKWDGIRDTFKF